MLPYKKSLEVLHVLLYANCVFSCFFSFLLFIYYTFISCQQMLIILFCLCLSYLCITLFLFGTFLFIPTGSYCRFYLFHVFCFTYKCSVHYFYAFFYTCKCTLSHFYCLVPIQRLNPVKMLVVKVTQGGGADIAPSRVLGGVNVAP